MSMPESVAPAVPGMPGELLLLLVLTGGVVEMPMLPGFAPMVLELTAGGLGSSPAEPGTALVLVTAAGGWRLPAAGRPIAVPDALGVKPGRAGAGGGSRLPSPGRPEAAVGGLGTGLTPIAEAVGDVGLKFKPALSSGGGRAVMPGREPACMVAAGGV